MLVAAGGSGILATSEAGAGADAAAAFEEDEEATDAATEGAAAALPLAGRKGVAASGWTILECFSMMCMPSVFSGNCS
jgi:predicted RNA methylase